MTRPAVIIGVGGTGQRVVLSLKKDLLEIGKGIMPNQVRLLAFDSADRIDPEEGVELEREIEYFQVGAPLYGLVSSIFEDQQRAANGAPAKMPHLHWFPAETTLPLGQAACNTMIGCGAYRPLGRLSLFNKVDAIVEKITRAMIDVPGHVYGDRNDAGNANLLEVLVVGSFAGGTGAGMFVDIGWLVRSVAETRLADKYCLRGFFLLPGGSDAGAGGVDAARRGRGFAAWRELNRSLLGSGKTRIDYSLANPDLNVNTNAICYDVTYLLDPKREPYPLQARPEEGIVPAIAHGMSLILDRKSGNKFTEFWVDVYMGLKAQHPGVYHSSFGCFSLKVPVYATEALFAQSLAIETFEALLKPIYGDQANPAGTFQGLSERSNLEKPAGWTGAAAAQAFLEQDALIAGVATYTNTPWLRIIGKFGNFTEPQRVQHITAIARSALSGQLLRYFDAISRVPQPVAAAGGPRPAMLQLTRELQWFVWDEAKTSREIGDTPQQAFARLTSATNSRGVAMVFRRRFGDETQYGTGEGNHGEFGTELQRVKVAQLEAFRRLLAEQMLVDLNGTTGTAVTARTGKLGYVQAFCKGLSASLDAFGAFVREVREKRSAELTITANTKTAIQQAQKEYNELSGKSCVFVWWDSQVHPEAHRAQRRYLKAVQVDMDRRRADIFLIAMAQTVAEMKAVVDATLKDLDNWVAHLTYGDSGANIQGLRLRMGKTKDNIVANQARYDRLGNKDFEVEKTFRGVSQAIAKREFVPQAAMVEEVLAAFCWTAAPEAGMVRFSCAVDHPGAAPAAAPERQLLARVGETSAAMNEKWIVGLCARQYRRLQNQVSQPLAVEVAQVFPKAGELAIAMRDHAGVYFKELPGGVAPPPLSKAAFVRVNVEHSPAQAQYFVDFLSMYRQQHTGLDNRLMYESEDQYKMSVMHVYDLIPSERFDMWHTCRGNYLELFQTLRETAVHIFPAEQNAAYYERRVERELQTNFRVFQPEVTALLEDRQRMSLFFKAFAMGFVTYRDETTDGVFNRFWGYKLNESSIVHLTNFHAGNDGTNVFALVSAFLAGHDVRHDMNRVVLIDWPKLVHALLLAEQDLKSNARSRYEEQMRGKPAGLVMRIRAGGAMGVQNNVGAAAAAQKYLDLSDLAELVYRDACQNLMG